MLKSIDDLILLHPPAVYDFREHHILFGPIADGIPSTPIFEIYPLGFFSIVECLEKHGFRVRIINLASRMLLDRRFDPEKLIASLRPNAFGIDLHWLPHAQGSIAIARLCKRYHPEIPVILGGYTATYFHEELIKYPEIDYILRGDSTEEPLLSLMRYITKQGKTLLTNIPNLTWKEDGCIRVNPLTHVPAKVKYANNYPYIFRHAIKRRNIRGMTPFKGWSYLEWFGSPVIPILTCRGCHNGCIFCGGSKKATERYCNRRVIAVRSADRVVKDILGVKRYTRAPLFIIGDIFHPGEKYGYALLDGLKGIRLKNLVVLELFRPAPEPALARIRESIPNFAFEISPETHDERIRKILGKGYTNIQLEENIRLALEYGAKRVEAFFMIGLPEQTRESVMETVEYCGRLMDRFDRRFVPYIFPYAPFVDPGCTIFEEAEKYGYRIIFRSLEEYISASTSPIWKYSLSYETRWLSRDDIVDCSYRAGMRLNELKFRHGVIDEQTYEQTRRKIELAIEITSIVDDLIKRGEDARLKQRLREMRPHLEILFDSLLNEKIHKEWKKRETLKKILGK